MSTLVVYFSRKGYAAAVAKAEAERLHGDLLALETPERTAGYLGFWWCGRFGMHRWGMALKPYNMDVSAYDRVVVVSPVWVFTLCAPMRTFIRQEAGRVHAADYVLLHFSFPMRYPKTIRWMDETLGVTHDRFDSVCCILGHCVRRRRVDGDLSAQEDGHNGVSV